MTLLQAIILGVVEGLTEFLPVSSTGHLILAEAALGLKGDAADTYSIVIQVGAITAVAFYYWRTIFAMTAGVLRRDRASWRIALQILVAFLPAAITGKLFHKAIQQHLFNPMTVAAALIVGGLVMIWADRSLRHSPSHRDGLAQLSFADAIWIGLAQCCSLWPGMSRSMTTIVAAQFRGCDNRLAADFSFLLGLLTLTAATCYELLKNHSSLGTLGSPTILLVGVVVSFIVGWAAVAGFLKVVQRFGMVPFAIYRLAAGLIILALYATGRLS